MHLDKTALAVFAHPDDESFLMGGTIALLGINKARVFVVCATRGEKGRLNLNQPLSDKELANLRERELKNALAVLGAQDAIMLGYPDGRLDASHEEILKRLLEIINLTKPFTVVTFGPDGITGHRDHITIGKAATEAFRLARAKPGGPAELYWIAFPKKRLDILRKSMESYPRTFGHYLNISFDNFEEQGLEHIDISGVIELKKRAIMAYKSQNPRRLIDLEKAIPDLFRNEYFYKYSA